MKKTILMSVYIFAIAFSSQAQTSREETKEKNVRYGLRIGYEFQANDSDLEYKLKIPYVGVYSDIRLREKWGLKLELNLRSEKRDRSFNNGLTKSDNEVYLTIPVLFKYKVTDMYSFYAGTQFLSASLVSNNSGIKKWNGILGVEYNLMKCLFIDARLRYALEGRKTNDFRDNRISIGVGYKF